MDELIKIIDRYGINFRTGTKHDFKGSARENLIADIRKMVAENLSQFLLSGKIVSISKNGLIGNVDEVTTQDVR